MAHDERIRVRVKWGNVARAAVALAALALVVAWPKLGGEPPALPDDRAVPFAAATAQTTPRASTATGEAKAGFDAAGNREARVDGEAEGRSPGSGARPRRGAAGRSRKPTGRRAGAKRRSDGGRARKPAAGRAGATRRSIGGRTRKSGRRGAAHTRRSSAGRSRREPVRKSRSHRATLPVPPARAQAAPSPGAAAIPASPPRVPASPPVTGHPRPDPEFGFEG